MFLHQTQAGNHPFADRHAGYDDNEFGKTITLVHLKNAAQIHVGFARAGFHLHRKIHSLQLLNLGQGVRFLHEMQIAQQCALVQLQPIAQAQFGQTGQRPRRHIKLKCPTAQRLPVEQPQHGIYRLALVGLVAIEFDFHAVVRFQFFMHWVR